MKSEEVVINKDNIMNGDNKNNAPPEKNIIIEDDKKKMDIARNDFNQRIKQYLAGGNPMYRQDGKINEFEIRFGTNTQSGRPLSKIDYDNVVKQLLRTGFSTENMNGSQMLRINYQDSLTDERKMANIRAEIVGVDLIQEYCRTNSIQKIIDMPSNFTNKIQFTRKSSTQGPDGNWQKPIDMFDMNFRVSYQLEQTFHTQVPFIKSVISTWSDRKKTFRMLNRTRFSHPDFPIFADLSIIRSSKKYAKNNGGAATADVLGRGSDRTFKSGGTNVPVPKYTIQEAGVFENVETYEIELELDNSRIGSGTAYDTPEKLMNVLRTCIRIVLCGIQKTNYPISFTERDIVLNSYMKVIREGAISNSNEKQPTYHYKKININNKREFFEHFSFIGPSSITLQREHILPKIEGSAFGNVLENYTVTDKADGERKLLFIHEDGRIFLIDNNFNVEFTGMKTNEKTVFYSILDGEHIKYDKKGDNLQLYAAFDVYYINKKSFREKMFYPGESDELKNNYRLPVLQQIVELLKPSSVVGEKKINEWKEKKDKQGNMHWVNQENGKIVNTKPKIESACSLLIECKQFEIVSETKNIFECCSNIWKKIQDGLYTYHTDGLIFTPTNVGVGGSGPGLTGPLSNATWELSFKWKPVEQNTVDFLVTVKKDKTGKDEVLHIFQEGVNTTGEHAIEQYKTLELMCGYNEKEDGFLNPFQDILNDNIPPPLTKMGSNENRRDYRPEVFRPTDPYDANAYITKIKLKSDGSDLFMISEEGEYFDDFTIVEFRYDSMRPPDMRWIPLRVRYDKTQKLKNGEKQFGNAYRVANSNWRSIHYPITIDMITTGENIPEFVEDESVYYKGNSENNTQGLRDFHNLFVKKKLIMGVSNRGDTLIDYAVGMGGDLSKWIMSKLSFVFGVDIVFSNIHNNKRGACARYLNLRRDNQTIPSALFIVGDSGLNIRELKAFTGDKNSKDKMVANAVFGKGPKDPTIIGKGTYSNYGVGENGFSISSCQFAVHYFFETNTKLHGFLRNLAECTKINGYFIGTCYDGKSVFKILNKKKIGESAVFMTEDRNRKPVKICEIVKQYHDSGFPDDDTSVGYPIDVYQESINQMVREYLVNFNYLTEMMENYGFVLIPKEEAKNIGLPSNTGMFSELFEYMQNEIKRDPRSETNYKSAKYMSSAEKSVSFLNRYFVFKKTTHVNAEKISKLFLKGISSLDDDGNIEMNEIEEEFEKTLRKRPAVNGEIKKTKLRAKLQKVAPAVLMEDMTTEEELFTLPIQENTEEKPAEKTEEKPEKKTELDLDVEILPEKTQEKIVVEKTEIKTKEKRKYTKRK